MECFSASLGGTVTVKLHNKLCRRIHRRQIGTHFQNFLCLGPGFLTFNFYFPEASHAWSETGEPQQNLFGLKKKIPWFYCCHSHHCTIKLSLQLIIFFLPMYIHVPGAHHSPCTLNPLFLWSKHLNLWTQSNRGLFLKAFLGVCCFSFWNIIITDL